MTELELKSLRAEEEKRWTTTGKDRVENWLCRAIWRKRRALMREKHLNNIKESAEMEKAPKKTQSNHFNWNSIAKQDNPEKVLTDFFQTSIQSPRTKKMSPNPRDSTG